LSTAVNGNPSQSYGASPATLEQYHSYLPPDTGEPQPARPQVSKIWTYRALFALVKLTSDHVAKFHGDRPMQLKDLALKNETKKRKETAVKHKTAGNYRSGRPNYEKVRVHTGL